VNETVTPTIPLPIPPPPKAIEELSSQIGKQAPLPLSGAGLVGGKGMTPATVLTDRFDRAPPVRDPCSWRTGPQVNLDSVCCPPARSSRDGHRVQGRRGSRYRGILHMRPKRVAMIICSRNVLSDSDVQSV
jgi:hypothetical protein